MSVTKVTVAGTKEDDVAAISTSTNSDVNLGLFLTLCESFGRKNNSTSLAAKIRDIESQMLEDKLVLLGDDGLLLKPSRSTHVVVRRSKDQTYFVGDATMEHKSMDPCMVSNEKVTNLVLSQDQSGMDSSRDTRVYTHVTTGMDHDLNNINDGKVVVSEHVTYTGNENLRFVNDSNKVNSMSFANVVHADKTLNKVYFRTLDLESSNSNEFELKIPMSSVMEVNGRMCNTLYGYFIDNREAFSVAEN
ncbi:hypothetical protein CTI12_AA545840 [Artemisia annua]|uniref:Uncharacterized protein n=1 Tax=Artemisia annua TaxID=35608 RepID=A0A2U1L011_ARTAN|nr:hypothetical protein CTI12_AA545840 [Artemisia annua]